MNIVLAVMMIAFCFRLAGSITYNRFRSKDESPQWNWLLSDVICAAAMGFVGFSTVYGSEEVISLNAILSTAGLMVVSLLAGLYLGNKFYPNVCEER